MRSLAPYLILCVIAVAGCGGGSGDDTADPAASPAASAASTEEVQARTFEPVDGSVAANVKAGTSMQRLRMLLKVEPILVQRPYRDFSGGCLYYRMRDRALADAWKFCLNDEGVQVLVTSYAFGATEPPDGASEARQALLGRADFLCESQNGLLATITKKVARTLAARPTDANRAAAGETIDDFVANLDRTHEELVAFEAPPELLETWTGYLDLLDQQVDVLSDAGAAYAADGDSEEYQRLGDEFTRLGEEAKPLAKEYGLVQCSASTFE